MSMASYTLRVGREMERTVSVDLVWTGASACALCDRLFFPAD